MPDILADIKSNPQYRSLSVADQFVAADIILNKRLAANPDFQALAPADKEVAKKLLLARAPTFADPRSEALFKSTGEGYLKGLGGDETAKNAYEFVHGMIRGSGVASFVRSAVEKGEAGKEDSVRGLDYYMGLDRIQGKSAGWAGAGQALGSTAEVIAISMAMEPAVLAVAKPIITALRGGKAALAAVEAAKAAAGVGKATKIGLSVVHPGLEMTAKIATDALVTAGPLYLADELKRTANGKPSIASEGAGKVLVTLGQNAAADFVWGNVQAGLFLTAARFGKAIFSMKPNELADAMGRVIGDNDAQQRAFLSTGDPVMRSKMTPYQRAQNDQIQNIDRWLSNPDLELSPLGKSQNLAQWTGRTIERTDTGAYKVWELDDDLMPMSRDFDNLNDATNDVVYKAYEKYQTLSAEEQSHFVDENSQWFLARGMALKNQDQLLKAFKATDVDVKLGEMNELGFEVKSPKERVVITRAEADAMNRAGPDPINGAVIQAYLPFDKALIKNALEGEFNLYKGRGAVRVESVKMVDAPDVSDVDSLLLRSNYKTTDTFRATFPRTVGGKTFTRKLGDVYSLGKLGRDNPGLADIKIGVLSDTVTGADGHFKPKEKLIEVHPDSTLDSGTVRHEIVHAIQFLQGRMKNVSGKMGMKLWDDPKRVPELTEITNDLVTRMFAKYKKPPTAAEKAMAYEIMKRKAVRIYMTRVVGEVEAYGIEPFGKILPQGTVKAAHSDAPNVAFIGTHGATPDQYAAATAKAEEIIKTDPKLVLEDARASYLLDRGVDYYAHPDGTYEFFTPRNGKLIGTPDDVTSSIMRNLKKTGQGSSASIVIETVGKMKLGAHAFTGDPRIVTRAALQAIRSKDPKQMEEFVKIYMEGYGKKVDSVYVSKAGSSTDMGVPAMIMGKQLQVWLPNKPLSIDAEREYVRNLFDNLKKLSGDIKEVHTGDFYAKRFDDTLQSPAPFEFGLDTDVDAVPWLTHVAQKLGGTYKPSNMLERFKQGGILTLPSVGRLQFASLSDAVNYVARTAVDPAGFEAGLRMEGVGIKKIGDRLVAYNMQSGKQIAQASGHFKLMEALDMYPQYLDSKYGPSEIRYVDGKVEMTIASQVIKKSPIEAGKFLSKFKDTDLLAKQKYLKVSPAGELSIDPVKNYRVYLSKFDYVQNFDNINDARLLFERDVPVWDKLKEIAEKKDIDLQIRDGHYQVRIGDETLTANSVDDLAAIMKRVPDLEESAPNILDSFDPSIERDVKSVVDTYMKAKRRYAGRNTFNAPPEFIMDPAARQMGSWMTFRSATSQFTSWVKDVANRTNRPQLLKLMTEFNDGRRLAQVNAIMGDKFIKEAFTVDGKMMPLASRQKVYYAMSVKNSETAAKALNIQYVQKFGKMLESLTPAEQQAADKAEQFLSNLSKKFGFEFKDLIFKYMPQIRDFNAPKNRELLNGLGNADDLARAAMGHDLPRSLDFFAKHERTNSIFAYTTKDDPLELLMLYNAQGHKKLYMDESWQKIAKYLEQDPAADATLKTRLNIFREQVMGYYHSPGEKVVEQFGEKLFRGLKRSALFGGVLKDIPEETMAAYGKNILRNAMSVTYMIQLGFKPWTAIRNSMQSLTTLAPRFGLARTIKSYNDVLAGGDEFFDGLRMRGIITEVPPIVDEIAMESTKLGKATAASLQWLKNGDDLSRAVAYKCGLDSFQDGMDWLATHPQDIAGFQRISGLSVLDPMTKNQITEMALKGEVAGAQDTFAAIVVKDTAFTNDAAESSMMRHGLVGKLFGQYGSYSESYRSNMFNMLKYGSAADRVRMVSTYLAICGVMTEVFSQMGIKTNDFLPTGPGVFTGGPNFHLAVNAIKTPQLALDALSNNWTLTDQKTLYELQFQAKGALPLAYQLRYLKKAAEYYQAGDSWKGWLSLTGVPTTKDE